MMRDLASNLSTVALIANATYSADTTPVSVDLSGYNSAAVLILLGAGGITFSTTNKIEFVLTHSDDDVTYTPVTDADIQGVTGTSNGIIQALIAPAASASVAEIGYIGARRYLRLLADFSGTHGAGTPIGAVVIRSHPYIGPA